MGNGQWAMGNGQWAMGDAVQPPTHPLQPPPGCIPAEHGWPALQRVTGVRTGKRAGGLRPAPTKEGPSGRFGPRALVVPAALPCPGLRLWRPVGPHDRKARAAQMAGAGSNVLEEEVRRSKDGESEACEERAGGLRPAPTKEGPLGRFVPRALVVPTALPSPGLRLWRPVGPHDRKAWAALMARAGFNVLEEEVRESKGGESEACEERAGGFRAAPTKEGPSGRFVPRALVVPAALPSPGLRLWRPVGPHDWKARAAELGDIGWTPPRSH
jgi:hypothetical protein